MRNLLQRHPASSSDGAARGLPLDPSGQAMLVEQPAAAFVLSATGGLLPNGPSPGPGSPNRQGKVQRSAQTIYNEHFSGLESYGASGMTILEELIEFALLACERGRASVAGAAAAASAHHNASRGAAALGPDGKVCFCCGYQ
jgi:hypothetical protein